MNRGTPSCQQAHFPWQLSMADRVIIITLRLTVLLPPLSRSELYVLPAFPAWSGHPTHRYPFDHLTLTGRFRARPGPPGAGARPRSSELTQPVWHPSRSRTCRTALSPALLKVKLKISTRTIRTSAAHPNGIAHPRNR